MTNILDLTGKLEPDQLAIFSTLDEITSELNIPYLVIGATARDLVMHYGYGVPIKRATADLDYGICIPTWDKYDELTATLRKRKFTKLPSPCRFKFPDESILDLVPFGGVQNQEAFIEWPPEDDMTMNMLGFEEALANAQRVKVQDSPELIISVANPVGLALLKTIAWADRTRDKRSKDALDLLLLLKSYEELPGFDERMYEDFAEILEQYDFDQRFTSAYILGFDMGLIASAPSQQFIQSIIDNKLDDLNPEILAEEMSARHGGDLEVNTELVAAFFAGFTAALPA